MTGHVPGIDRPVRLAGGELLLDPDTIPVIRALIEHALATRRSLWTARNPDQARRVARLRALTQAAYADVSATATAQPANGHDPAQSSPRSMTAMMTVQEAAGMLNVSPQRVRQLLGSGRLAGRQTAPGSPWHVDPDSVHAYRQERDHV